MEHVAAEVLDFIAYMTVDTTEVATRRFLLHRIQQLDTSFEFSINPCPLLARTLLPYNAPLHLTLLLADAKHRRKKRKTDTLPIDARIPRQDDYFSREDIANIVKEFQESLTCQVGSINCACVASTEVGDELVIQHAASGTTFEVEIRIADENDAKTADDEDNNMFERLQQSLHPVCLLFQALVYEWNAARSKPFKLSGFHIAFMLISFQSYNASTSCKRKPSRAPPNVLASFLEFLQFLELRFDWTTSTRVGNSSCLQVSHFTQLKAFKQKLRLLHKRLSDVLEHSGLRSTGGNSSTAREVLSALFGTLHRLEGLRERARRSCASFRLPVFPSCRVESASTQNALFHPRASDASSNLQSSPFRNSHVNSGPGIGASTFPKAMYIFDFDGTLVNTLGPEQGREEYERATGEVPGFRGWWGRPESLHLEIPALTSEAGAALWQLHSLVGSVGACTLVLTGRHQGLSHLVQAALNKHGAVPDRLILNDTGEDTLQYKLRQMDRLIESHPSVEVVCIWEDRVEHHSAFTEHMCQLTSRLAKQGRHLKAEVLLVQPTRVVTQAESLVPSIETLGRPFWGKISTVPLACSGSVKDHFSIDGGYLKLVVSAPKSASLVTSAQQQAKDKRDGEGKYHITMVRRAEVNQLWSSASSDTTSHAAITSCHQLLLWLQASANALVPIHWTSLGVGVVGDGAGATAIFESVLWRHVDWWREEVLSLPPSALHITLGFHPRDVHNADKRSPRARVVSGEELGAVVSGAVGNKRRLFDARERVQAQVTALTSLNHHFPPSSESPVKQTDLKGQSTRGTIETKPSYSIKPQVKLRDSPGRVEETDIGSKANCKGKKRKAPKNVLSNPTEVYKTKIPLSIVSTAKKQRKTKQKRKTRAKVKRNLLKQT